MSQKPITDRERSCEPSGITHPDLLDVQQLMSRVEILALLPSPERLAISKLLCAVKSRSGKTIVKEGSENSELVFIAEGQVKVCRVDERGREVILALLGQGDFFGELALLTGMPRCADVITLMPCELLILDGRDFLSHIEKWPNLGRLMLRGMAKRVQLASQRITELSLFDVCCRVARTLWGLGAQQQLDDQVVSFVREAPTHQTLAGMVGSSREVVSRALKSLEQQGHIYPDQDAIIVRSLP